jgi:hypothetical protein
VRRPYTLSRRLGVNRTTALSVVVVGLGLAVIARTIAAGVGGGLGLLLGGLLVLAGSLRLFLARR